VQTPTWLHFDLGSDLVACRRLQDGLRSLGATINEDVHPFSVPMQLKSELDGFLRMSLRLLDEMDVEPCEVELRSVLVHMDGAQTLSVNEPANGLLNGVRAGYVAAEPGVTEIHHHVIAPKHGNAPPAAVSAVSNEWSVTPRPHVWHLHSKRQLNGGSKPDITSLLRRDREKIASLFKGVDDIEISSSVEQVVARWSYPLQLAPYNVYRTSLRRLIGVSDRRLADPAEVCAEIKRNHDRKLRNEAETRSRIISNLDPCRRIALAQGVTPLLMGWGLIPVTATPNGPRFADHFCTRAAAYAATELDAAALLSAFHELMYFLVHSGYSPILSPSDSYDQVVVWAQELQQETAARPKNSQTRDIAGEQNAIAAGERVFSVAPARQFQRLEDAARGLLAERFGARLNLRDAGLLGVPFRTAADSDGNRIGGCLFALVAAPNLDRALLEHLGICESIFLHRTPFKLVEPARPIPQIDETAERIAQAKEHHSVWLALEAVRREPPGTKLIQIAARYPDAYAVYLKYPQLKAFEKEIENTTKLSHLMGEIFKAITGGSDPNYMYKVRALAGLPSRKRSKAAAR
jgi:hypothetical protein